MDVERSKLKNVRIKPITIKKNGELLINCESIQEAAQFMKDYLNLKRKAWKPMIDSFREGKPWNIEGQTFTFQINEDFNKSIKEQLVGGFPNLKPINRDRESKLYSQELIDQIVFMYLFEGKSHRKLDEDVLGIDSNESRGWQAMNILHHLGLWSNHKGIFKDTSYEQAIQILGKLNEDKHINQIYECLLRYSNSRKSYASFSWRIIDLNIADKDLDKSAFEHRGTGIPMDIRPFFKVENLLFGERKELVLYSNDEKFNAHITMDKMRRTRMFWDKTFSVILQETFPNYYEQYLNDENQNDKPILRFERIDHQIDSYKIKLIHPVKIETVEQDIEADNIENDVTRNEGAITTYYGKLYERDPINRKRAIEIHGLSCVACGFNFEQAYGERGKDFIEVHHTKPLHTFGGEQQAINPETDLVPVCSNCHRIIHRRHEDVLSIDKLKEILKEINGKT